MGVNDPLSRLLASEDCPAEVTTPFSSRRKTTGVNTHLSTVNTSTVTLYTPSPPTESKPKAAQGECTECKGSGWTEEGPRHESPGAEATVCPMCSGSGRLTYTVSREDGYYDWKIRDCPTCHGTGKRP